MDSSQSGTTTVIVSGTREGKYSQEITAGGHNLFADEPADVGGKNLGPSPYELLLSSLGACTSITVRMYADFKKIPLEKTIVTLKHYKIYSEDCQNCEKDKNARIDVIDIEIEFQGETLTPEQRKKLLEIAGKCPVHRTLTSKMTINSVLVP